MKCRKCGARAVLNMRQHRLSLCREHFLEWLPQQTQRFIEKYRMFTHEERILVAVSGGKDSLGLWDVLQRLGYQADGLYIDLGIEQGSGYSSVSRQMASAFADAHQLTLHIVDVPATLGASIPTAAQLTRRGVHKPCSVCGLTKRHIMNRVARDLGYAVLATGHNLDDEVAVLFGNTLSWATGYLARQAPVLDAEAGFVRKVKPFCRLYERESAAYTLLRGIDYVYEECPHAEGATSIYYKDVLNRMEAERPGIKLSFYLSFLQARAGGFLQPATGAVRPEMQPCPNCGQPTTSGGTCSFCRTWDSVRSRLTAPADSTDPNQAG
jgi:uncharacterized protein (TIGR00269 family)